MERKKLPYGVPNFKKVAEGDYIFIDKTPFVEKLESLGEQYIFFLRPRKFGKSLFVSMLEHYYDMRYSDDFERLFGDFHIGRRPTPLRNSYLVLLFDFSGINTETKETTFIYYRKEEKNDTSNKQTRKIHFGRNSHSGRYIFGGYWIFHDVGTSSGGRDIQAIFAVSRGCRPSSPR